MPPFTTFTGAQLQKAYEDFTCYTRVDCTLAQELVGGVPADDAALHAFVKHHLKIEDPAEAEKAFMRIKNEELEDVTPSEGEIKEKRTYQVCALHRDQYGPWLGDWMIKAALKQAASRVGLFTDKRGTKGNFSEAGRARAFGISLVDEAHPNVIYLRNPAGDGPAKTYHKTFMGRVQTPQGPVSIIHQSECCEIGSRFEFEFRFPRGTGRSAVNEQDIKDVLALFMIVGLGSARSMERGKVFINSADIYLTPRREKSKGEEDSIETKPAKANGVEAEKTGDNRLECR